MVTTMGGGVMGVATGHDEEEEEEGDADNHDGNHDDDNDGDCNNKSDDDDELMTTTVMSMVIISCMVECGWLVPASYEPLMLVCVAIAFPFLYKNLPTVLYRRSLFINCPAQTMDIASRRRVSSPRPPPSPPPAPPVRLLLLLLLVSRLPGIRPPPLLLPTGPEPGVKGAQGCPELLVAAPEPVQLLLLPGTLPQASVRLDMAELQNGGARSNESVAPLLLRQALRPPLPPQKNLSTSSTAAAATSTS